VEGEAQIVLARGKKKFIYDFTVVLNFEVKVRDVDSQQDGGLTKDKGKFSV
jgi:Activator of Hsp90 ATPase, N-terminal